jgi:hypothetical protein
MASSETSEKTGAEIAPSTIPFSEQGSSCAVQEFLDAQQSTIATGS